MGVPAAPAPQSAAPKGELRSSPRAPGRSPLKCREGLRQVLLPGFGDYHQGVQVMPLCGEALVTRAQTRKARLAELLVG